jgi:hypothetical protein
MAGAGYKLFNTGDVLTAAQVNTYLQEQVVMVFASAAARTTALSGVLAEGMVSYLKDTDATEVYNGTAWVSIGSSGDITSVTAGTGLSGGGTSGDVTLSLSVPVTEVRGGTNQTTYTTGDLLYASASNTLTKRAIGTTGQVLTVSGGVPTWATPAGGGKVLQVVYGSTTTTTDITSSTYADTSLSATITPSATSSKVLIFTSQTALIFSGSLLSHGSRILRGSTAIFTGGVGSDGHIDIGSYGSPVYLGDRFTMTYLDSPNTTSATTYKTQGIKNYGNTLRYQAGNYESTIILMEIGA